MNTSLPGVPIASTTNQWQERQEAVSVRNKTVRL